MIRTQRLLRKYLVAAIATLLLSGSPMAASADECEQTVGCGAAGCGTVATCGHEGGADGGGGDGSAHHTAQGTGKQHKTPYELAVEKVRAHNEALAAQVKAAMAASAACFADTTRDAGQCIPPAFGDPQALPQAPKGTPARTPAQPALTAEQAAYLVVATSLQVPAEPPGFGPPPSINRWKMAAVGYPYWLWHQGADRVTATRTITGVTVTVTAVHTATTYRMGDGHQLTCTGNGTPWTRAVEPGTASPTCGYVYTTPSLPRGDYTITAVDSWTINYTGPTGAGTLPAPVVRSATLQVPVGELQALVR